MRGNTKPNEKFNKARAYCADHSEVGSVITNWKRMGWRTLYAALMVRGVSWDANSKTWFALVDTSTAPKQQVKVAPRHTQQNQETVLVRIIAGEAAINQAVSELLDIARASNLTLLRNSGLISTHDGRSKRVYLKFLLEKPSKK